MGRTVLLFIILLGITVATPFAGSLERGAWRPYTNPTALVTRGMTKGEVLVKAGNPDLTEVISIGINRRLSISIWTYVRTGHNAAVANLTFRGNRLVRIETNIVQ